MTIKAITQYLENIAPPQYQESYDNSGLIVGYPETAVKGVLVALDVTEAVVEEALERGCNLIIAHHPIVFKPLKRFNGQHYTERVVMAAIKHDVAIYAIHTNLDNVYANGVNAKIGAVLGLENTRILVPKTQILSKLTTFAPIEAAEKVTEALFAAGAGQIGAYKDCSFQTTGTGTFTPTATANPYIGTRHQAEKVAETRIEVVFPSHISAKILAALRQAHPYEEVAYYLQNIENAHTAVGSGLIGSLPQPMSAPDFLRFLKEKMGAGCVRYTAAPDRPIQRVAVCGGSGSFLIRAARAAQADVYVTADVKYHEFFEAESALMIADIGHYESEQFTIDLLQELVKEKFAETQVFSTKKLTNPINYM